MISNFGFADFASDSRINLHLWGFMLYGQIRALLQKASDGVWKAI